MLPGGGRLLEVRRQAPHPLASPELRARRFAGKTLPVTVLGFRVARINSAESEHSATSSLRGGRPLERSSEVLTVEELSLSLV